MKKDAIIVIAGPTGSGKTQMAVELAKKIDGEIINADSRSIYKETDLGTGKPTDKERQGIPHHLFDIVSPNEFFSVADFQKIASEKITEIQSRKHIPIIVGGTGLYIDALVYNFNLTEQNFNSDLRTKLNKKTLEELQSEIKQINENLVNESEWKNKRRLIRALEVYKLTGRKKSEEKKDLPENVYYFAINVNREELYQKLNDRVDNWIENGFEKEVKNLLKKYNLKDPGMSGTGHKQFGRFLKGEIFREEAIEKFKQSDRNLAKRQLTWFKKNKDIIWIKNMAELIKKINT